MPATGYGQGRWLRTFLIARGPRADQLDDRPIHLSLRATTRINLAWPEAECPPTPRAARNRTVAKPPDSVSVCSEPEPAVAGMIATWSWIAGGTREGDKPSRNRRQQHRGHALWALPSVPPRRLPAHGMRLAMSTCSLTKCWQSSRRWRGMEPGRSARGPSRRWPERRCARR